MEGTLLPAKKHKAHLLIGPIFICEER